MKVQILGKEIYRFHLGMGFKDNVYQCARYNQPEWCTDIGWLTGGSNFLYHNEMVTHDDPKYKVNPTKVFHAGKVFVPKPNGKIDEYIDVHLDSRELTSKDFLHIENIYYRNANITLEDKMKLNRNKDQNDISLLNEYLASQFISDT